MSTAPASRLAARRSKRLDAAQATRTASGAWPEARARAARRPTSTAGLEQKAEGSATVSLEEPVTTRSATASSCPSKDVAVVVDVVDVEYVVDVSGPRGGGNGSTPPPSGRAKPSVGSYNIVSSKAGNAKMMLVFAPWELTSTPHAASAPSASATSGRSKSASIAPALCRMAFRFGRRPLPPRAPLSCSSSSSSSSRSTTLVGGLSPGTFKSKVTSKVWSGPQKGHDALSMLNFICPCRTSMVYSP
mmetsp:Transcript_126781/g.366970  ORF Transcript_126781/g.366970 Transcript_126781/m.366970 type:complete len:246 (-) Transcript_126781:34-771(-)